LSNFKQKLTFDGIKPFILVVMQMFGRISFFVKGVFDNENAVAVFWRYFESNRANTKSTMFSELVFVCSNTENVGFRFG